VPWKEGEFNNSLLEIAGQDLNKLGSYVDFISPMCYSHMLKKEPNWINQVVKDHKKQSQISVIPAVQVKECYLTDKLTKNNLKKIIKESIKKPSGGIILWSWDYIEDSEIYNWLNIEFRDLFFDI